jgi:two-component system, OmpR family, sensor histidine kinase KdpD
MATRRDLLVGVPAAAGAVALVSMAVAVLDSHVPVLSLAVLYELAVIPVAVAWGMTLAAATAVASMLAFNFFFLPPTHTFRLHDAENWLALAVYLVTAIVVSVLATQARRRSLLASERALEAEAIRRSDTMKTAVLHAVSHDLRSPLTSIVAASSGLANEDVHLTDAERAELASSIRSEAERLDRVVGNLLDLSRLRSGVAEPHQELWTADDLVARALEALGPGQERVVTELDADAPPVHVDAGQIERALVNLLDNALKFSPAGSRVVLRVETQGDQLRFHVEDRGPGVDGDDAALFEPFSPSARGVGLGLAIARGFAEVNGARVWAEEGGGGHFVLALPA